MKDSQFSLQTVMMVSVMQAADKPRPEGHYLRQSLLPLMLPVLTLLMATDLYASISNRWQTGYQLFVQDGQADEHPLRCERSQGSFEQIEGYVISPDGKKLLIMTHREAIYRRSFKAEYFAC